MTTICKTCNEEEDKQLRPGLICEQCMCFVHLTCLCRPGTPGDFSCDVFFDFTCADCSPDKKEVVIRYKFPWVNVIYLSLHHLSIHSYGISNFGFFHYKTHVGSFIDRNWTLLFGWKCKQKKNWIGTIAGVLSVYNNVLFRSGSTELHESGWWRLQHSFSPAVAAHILQEISRDKQPKTRGKSHMHMDRTLFLQRAIEMGYKDLIAVEESHSQPKSSPHEGQAQPAAKKRRVDSDDLSGVSSNSYYDYYIDSDSRNEIPDDVTHDYASTSLLKEASYSDAESSFRGFDFVPMVNIPEAPPSECAAADPPPRRASRTSPPRPAGGEVRGGREAARRVTLFSSELNSVDMPWMEEEEEPADLVEITEYAEIQLLKQVEGLIPRVKERARRSELRRFRAKLALRRLKRHKHLPVFDLDKAVKLLGGYVTEDAKVVTNVERVLDRFQRSYLMDNLSGTVWQPAAGAIVVANVPPETIRSPYSGVLLKPYIRRDRETVPLYVSLCEELLTKANRKNKEFVLPARAPLDYSYVRPHHIAAVNALCAQHFWPGVDLTEALQYPEHSCVVLHRRLVVACAFLVPNAVGGSHYISFVLVRPEWRRANLATFMLYHLLQTCSGSDVTLHVSPTNPAIFLYQKFGFKVEELVQDFYEKYFDIDYKGCRHALLLRLTR